jgi:hypothetical protein
LSPIFAKIGLKKPEYRFTIPLRYPLRLTYDKSFNTQFSRCRTPEAKSPPTPELGMLCLDHHVERWKWKGGTKKESQNGETVALKEGNRTLKFQAPSLQVFTVYFQGM